MVPSGCEEQLHTRSTRSTQAQRPHERCCDGVCWGVMACDKKQCDGEFYSRHRGTQMLGGGEVRLTCTLRKKFLSVASFWTISPRLCWLKVMGWLHAERQNSSRSCRAVNSRSASRIVMKFFRDLDIFSPSMARCPLWSQ